MTSCVSQGGQCFIEKCENPPEREAWGRFRWADGPSGWLPLPLCDQHFELLDELGPAAITLDPFQPERPQFIDRPYGG